MFFFPSLQDAISSILVARDGFGDMAVSNAIGSNVFDINLGLGLPFLIRTIVDGGKAFSLLDEELQVHLHLMLSLTHHLNASPTLLCSSIYLYLFPHAGKI